MLMRRVEPLTSRRSARGSAAKLGIALALSGAALARALPAENSPQSLPAEQGAAQTAPAPAPESYPAGVRSLREVLAASPAWQRADRDPDTARLAELRGVKPGWSVEVVYGPWCSDSAREVPRFIALLSALKDDAPETRWVAVDRDKREPVSEVRRLGIERVPTFVVSRGGRELGRIVETAEPSLEILLLRILKPSPPP
jgi:hypothetical protein